MPNRERDDMPRGMTLREYHAQQRSVQPRQTEPEEESRRPVRDVATSVGVGALNTLQGLTGLTSLAPGTDLREGGTPGLSHLYQGLGSAAERLGETRSDAALRASDNVMGAWEEGAPLRENIGSTLRAVGQNPYFMPNLIGEGLGSLGPTGKIAGTLGRVAPSMSLPSRVGAAEGSIYGGMVAGRVAEENPENYTARLLALPSAALAGTVGFAGSKYAGILDPETMVASIMRGGVRDAGRDITRDASGSLVGRILTAAGVQTAQEGIQEGQQQAFINLGTDRPIGEGVGQAATIGALAGAGVGSATAPFSGGASRRARRDLAAQDDGGPAPDSSPQDTGPQTPQDGPDAAPSPNLKHNDAEGVRAVVGELVRIHDNLTPEAAQQIVSDLSAEGGPLENIATGREGAQQVMDVLGITPENQPRATLALVAMSALSDTQLARGSRRLLAAMTGLKPGQVRPYHQQRSPMLQRRIDSLERSNAALEAQINRVGDHAPDKTAARIQLRDQNNTQLESLRVFKSAVDTLQQVSQEARQDRIQQQAERARGREMGDMFADQPQQMGLPLDQAGQPTMEPTVAESGQMDFIGQQGQTPLQNVPDAPPAPTVDSTGQIDMLGQPGDPALGQPPPAPQVPPLQLDQVDAQVDPAQQALDLPLPQAPETGVDPGPAQRPLRNAQAERRAERAERTTERALQQLSEMSPEDVLNMPDNPSLAQLSRLTGVRPATLREMSREGGAQQGSPMDVITRAVQQRKQEILQEQQQVEQVLSNLIDADPSLSPGRAIQQAQREFRNAGQTFPVRKVGDLPAETRQRLQEQRRQAREAPPGPKSEGPARGAGPVQAQLRPSTQLRSLPRRVIDRIISGIVGTWRNAPRFTVVENPMSDSIPAEVRDAFMGYGSDNVMAQLTDTELADLKQQVEMRKSLNRLSNDLLLEKAALERADQTPETQQRIAELTDAIDTVHQQLDSVLDATDQLMLNADRGFRDISQAAEASILNNLTNFLEWFGNSRVTDSNGRPQVVYRGMVRDVQSHDRSKNFFSDSATVAGSYAPVNKMNAGAIYPVFLQMQRPLEVHAVNPVDSSQPAVWSNISLESQVIDADGSTRNLNDVVPWGTSTDALADFARENGYDGVIIRDVVDPGPAHFSDQGMQRPTRVPSSVYITFEGTQAKSAIGNNGQFNPADPRMAYKLNEGAIPAAVFYNGEVYLNQAEMTSVEDVATAIYHEMVGHYGLRGLLGRELDTVMDQVADQRELDVRYFAEKYGLDMDNATERRLAAEEFVAHMAESLPNDSFVQRMVDLIRTALTGTWLGDALGIEAMNDSVIRTNLLRPALGFVATGEYKNPTKDQRRDMMFKLSDPGSTPRPDMAPEMDIMFRDTETKTRYRDSIREFFRDTKQALAFTTTIMWRLADRIPATRRLLEAGQEAQHIAGRWERRHQELGSRYTKVSFADRARLTSALVQYTRSESVPFVSEHAREIAVDADGAPILDTDGNVTFQALDPNNVQVDSSILDALPKHVQSAVKATFDTTSEILVGRTENNLRMARDSRDQLIERGEDRAEVEQMYRKAVTQITSIHNNRARMAYVPLSRFGDFMVEGYSREYLELDRQAEADGLENMPEGTKQRLDEMRRSPEHYTFQRYATEAEAKAAQQAMRTERRFDTVEYRKAQADKAEYGLSDYNSVAQLMEFIDQHQSEASPDGQRSGQWARVEETTRRLMRDLLAEMGTLDSETASQMDRDLIHGVVESQVLERTLEHVKHFGFVAANSATNLKKVSALGEMRSQLSQLTGEDSAVYVGYFNRLLERLNDPFDNSQSFMTSASRKVMGVSSLYLLLSNPSYYMMNATQTTMLTGPVLAGEVGPRAWGAIADAYRSIKPVYKGIFERGTEITFEGMPERQRNLFLTLQERNILDVGMTHEFGSLHQGRWGSVLQKLYNGARAVELINRSSAALASYNVKMDQLTKGRKFDSFSRERQDAMHAEAVDFAHWVVYKTHGDYSYNNASMIFRQPMLRAMLQFKKIGQIQAELLYDRAKTAWTKTTISDRSAEWFAEAQIDGAEPILQKIRNNEWITEAERAELEQRITEYRDSGLAELNLAPRDLDYLPVLLQEFSQNSFNTLESAAVAKKSFAYLLGTSTTIAGSLSVPFATTIIAAAMRLADSEEDRELDEVPAATIKRYLGPEAGNILLRGAVANVFGVDVSHRIGINFAEQFGGGIYSRYRMNDPQRSTSEAISGLLGPPASLFQDMAKSVDYWDAYSTTGSQHDLAKAVINMSPLGIRNMVTAKLLDEQGLVSDSRMTLIPKEDFTDGEIIRKAVGFQPSKVNEFYDMRQHMQDVEGAVNRKRLLLKRSYFEAIESGDSERINRVMRQWRDLQSDQKSVDIQPSPISELAQFVRQKRREDARAVEGILPTSRNRRLVERITGTHTSPTILEQDDADGTLFNP